VRPIALVSLPSLPPPCLPRSPCRTPPPRQRAPRHRRRGGAARSGAPPPPVGAPAVPAAGGTGDAEAVIAQRLADAGRAPGVPALRRSSDLDAVARDWSRRQAADGQMSHNPNLRDQVQPAWSWYENVGTLRGVPSSRLLPRSRRPAARDVDGVGRPPRQHPAHPAHRRRHRRRRGRATRSTPPWSSASAAARHRPSRNRPRRRAPGNRNPPRSPPLSPLPSPGPSPRRRRHPAPGRSRPRTPPRPPTPSPSRSRWTSDRAYHRSAPRPRSTGAGRRPPAPSRCQPCRGRPPFATGRRRRPTGDARSGRTRSPSGPDAGGGPPLALLLVAGWACPRRPAALASPLGCGSVGGGPGR
jgi:hypothetical protein